MPVATSSRRRKAARQASSDIEDDQPTQAARARDDVDDDDDEEHAPRRAKKEKVKKEKDKGKARQAPKEEDTDDDDDDDRIDIENFADQPLPKADAARILGITKDWQNVEAAMRQPSGIINGVAAAMAEVAGEEAQQVCLERAFPNQSSSNLSRALPSWTVS